MNKLSGSAQSIGFWNSNFELEILIVSHYSNSLMHMSSNILTVL